MIEIDPSVFAYLEDMGYSNESFVVDAPGQAALVVSALQRAAERFMCVDETGAEYADFDSAMVAIESGLYTPNYVSDPEVTESGVRVYVDCKGAMEDAMAARLREVLREELETAGVMGRVSAA